MVCLAGRTLKNLEKGSESASSLTREVMDVRESNFSCYSHNDNGLVSLLLVFCVALSTE